MNHALEALLFVVADGVEERAIAIETGRSLLELLREGGTEVAAICNGSLSCGTCHIFVPPSFYVELDPPGDLEEELLGASAHYRVRESRLACQVPADGRLAGARIIIAPDG